MKICPVGAELLHADRWTDMKLTVTFRSFVNMPKHWCALHQQITLFYSAS